MKYSKLMKERIRRVRVLLKELGYDLVEGEKSEETFSAAFENEDGFQGGFFDYPFFCRKYKIVFIIKLGNWNGSLNIFSFL